MTDWECLARPTEGTPGKAKHIRDYTMKPGDAYLYNIGVLHSPERKAATRLLRIEGVNMDRVKRRPYEAVEVVTAAAEYSAVRSRRNDFPPLDHRGMICFSSMT